MNDLISRQSAIDVMLMAIDDDWEPDYATDRMNELPSAQPEIIRCRDCAYRGAWQCPMYYEEYNWDMTEDDGFCHVAKKDLWKGCE